MHAGATVSVLQMFGMTEHAELIVWHLQNP